MRENITRLAFEVEQRGAARVEQSFRNLEDGVTASLDAYKRFSLEGRQNTETFEKNIKGLYVSLHDLEKGISQASRSYAGLFHSDQMRRQTQRLQTVKKEMEGLMKVMSTGSEEQRRAARERLESLQEIADKEAATSAKIFKQHKEEFDRLVEMKKKSLGELGTEAAKGSATAIQQILRGDVRGVGETAGRGIRGLGQVAEKAAFDRQVKAGAGGAAEGAMGAQLTRSLAQFAKVAGPLALIAGSLGVIIKLFLDFDSRVKEINKSMLDNVSLTDLASKGYGTLADQVGYLDITMRDFQETVLKSSELRMLGLDPDRMGAVVGALNEQGKMLADALEQGVSFGEMLETSQIAASNLGIDAQETAKFLSQLGDVSAQSFEESAESLVHIIKFAQDAGISTQRFFNTIQGLVGEMGLYNFRVEETAAILSKLSNVLDTESAEKFTREMTSAYKQMSATDRMREAVIVGVGRVVDAVDRRQQQIMEGLDVSKVQDALRSMGEEGIAEMMGEDFERAFASLSGRARDEVLSHLDKDAARQLSMYRQFFETNRNDLMQVQDRMADLGVGDQIAFQISSLERTLGMPLDRINSVLAESQGVSSDQLRMMQSFQENMRGDFAQLQRAAEEDAESFAEVAKQLGYSVTLEEMQNEGLSSWEDLLRVMTEEKMEDMTEEQKKQRTVAEKTADYQRSMLDTIKERLMGLVEGIYDTILGIYDAILSLPFFGGSSSERDRVRLLREEAVDGRRLRELEAMRGEGFDPRIEEEISKIRRRQEQNRLSREFMDRGMGGSSVAFRAGMGVHEFEGHLGAGMDIAKAQGMIPSHFEYEGETLGRFQGMRDKNYGDLQRVLVGEEWLEGEEMEQYLAEIAQMSKARDELDQEIERQLEEGNITAKSTEDVLERTRTVLEEKGISISDRTLRKMAEEQIVAEAYASAVRDLIEIGYDGGTARRYLDLGMQGNWEQITAMQGGTLDKSFEDVFMYYGLQEAGDARMVTKGVPLLNLQAGDMIIDQESLAQTVAGGKGDFVPEFLREVGRRGGSASAGGGDSRTLNATFNIYGGGTGVRDEILRVLQEWERARLLN